MDEEIIKSEMIQTKIENEILNSEGKPVGELPLSLKKQQWEKCVNGLKQYRANQKIIRDQIKKEKEMEKLKLKEEMKKKMNELKVMQEIEKEKETITENPQISVSMPQVDTAKQENVNLLQEIQSLKNLIQELKAKPVVEKTIPEKKEVEKGKKRTVPEYIEEEDDIEMKEKDELSEYEEEDEFELAKVRTQMLNKIKRAKLHQQKNEMIQKMKKDPPSIPRVTIPPKPKFTWI